MLCKRIGDGQVSKDADQVVALHQEGKTNCSQAMLLVYGKYFGVPEDLAMKVASGFGGGMGGMGKTCGAVSGAIAVLGLTYEIGNPGAKASVYALVKEFTKRFIARHGSIICNDLLGHDVNTPEGMQIIREKKLFTTVCSMADRSAAEILEEILAEKLPTYNRSSEQK